MKHAPLFAVFLLGLLASSHASFFSQSEDDDDNNVVVRLQFEADEEPPVRHSWSPFSFRPFRFLSRTRQQPRMSLFNEEQPDLSGILDNLFRIPPFEQQQSDSEPFNVVQVRIVGGDDSPFSASSSSDNNDAEAAFSGFSTIFNRMSSILDSIRSQSGSMSQDGFSTTSSSKPLRRRGGCSLLQACGSDIDTLCSYAKRINMAQAIPHCLSAHRAQLSEECGAFMDRRAAGDDQPEESTEAPAEDSSEETVTAEIIEEEATPVEIVDVQEQPAEETQAPAPTTPQESCRAAAKTLCPEASPSNMVELMVCLSDHQDSVPSLCLDTIKDTAAFNCAHDAQRFCPGVTDRKRIGQCLKPHLSDLAPKCVAAAKKMSPPAAAATAPLPNMAHFKSQGVDDAVDAPAIKSVADVTSGSSSNSTVLVIVGISGFVVLAVAITIVIVRRRRAALRQPVVSTVQLVNPSYGALPTAPQVYSAAFEPRPEDEL